LMIVHGRRSFCPNVDVQARLRQRIFNSIYVTMVVGNKVALDWTRFKKLSGLHDLAWEFARLPVFP